MVPDSGAWWQVVQQLVVQLKALQPTLLNAVNTVQDEGLLNQVGADPRTTRPAFLTSPMPC